MAIGAIQTGSKKTKVYGDPLVRLYSILNNLRLKYRDTKDKNIEKRYVDISDFGVRIVFVKSSQYTTASGYKFFYFALDDQTEDMITEFGEHLMFHLVSSGYMGYIREHQDGGHGRIFQKFIVDNGWGKKILLQRLEDWKTDPTKTFLVKWTKNLMGKFSIVEIIHRYPSLFDYLS